MDHGDAGTQGNSIIACSSTLPSETVVFVVSLPMTKTAFVAIEDLFIASVATTAGVVRENVQILSIDEFSSRSSRIITGRLLLSASVHVQTSVLIPAGQQTSIKDQTVLNSYLNKNGLPSGTLVVQYNSSVFASKTTPTPAGSGGSGTESASVSGATTTSNVPTTTMIGGAIGGISALLAITFLAFRYRRNHTARTLPPCLLLPCSMHLDL